MKTYVEFHPFNLTADRLNTDSNCIVLEPYGGGELGTIFVCKSTSDKSVDDMVSESMYVLIADNGKLKLKEI